jgi:single-stranded DNA-binding protein
VEIDGRINISSYTNKEGKPTTRTDVTIDNITRLSSRSAATTNASEAPSFETKKIVQQIATIEDFKDDTEEYQPIGEDSEINK